jgi:signal transduction histidine kinase
VKIHEVFINIIQNSIEAVDGGGIIRIQTSLDTERIRIEFYDNGSGISHDNISRIFTPFFTTKEQGSGLGLAFAHRIIKDHGGNITVTSSEGEGTTFVITLPVARELSTVARPRPSSP